MAAEPARGLQNRDVVLPILKRQPGKPCVDRPQRERAMGTLDAVILRGAQIQCHLAAFPGRCFPTAAREFRAGGQLVSDGELWGGCEARRGVGVVVFKSEDV